MLKAILLGALWLLWPLSALSASDLAVSSSDIKFSVAKPLSGDQIRIYATARNLGQQDARLGVRFFIDGAQLGNDQPTSLVVGGASTVFMDWTPSEGYYQVAVELLNINPEDGNAANNRAEIKDFLVNKDSDGDGKPDTEDLDDDNDGIDDGVEIINGTNPMKWDTDGDGVGDKDDAYPNDPSRSKLEVKIAPSEETTKPEVKAPEEEKPVEIKPEPTPQSSTPLKVATELDAPSVAIPDTNNRPLDVIIAKSRRDWRTWEFEALGGSDSINYLWDFGDKKLGEGRQVKHEFPGSGAYKVTLSVSDKAGGTGQTEETVIIGFWHLANPWLQALLGILGLLSGGLIVLAIFDFSPWLKKQLTL